MLLKMIHDIYNKNKQIKNLKKLKNGEWICSKERTDIPWGC